MSDPSFIDGVALGKAFCEKDKSLNGVSLWRIDYRDTVSTGRLVALMVSLSPTIGLRR